MVCLFVEGDITVRGMLGSTSSPGDTRAGPQVQRVFALSVHGSTALAEKGWGGGASYHSVTQVDNSNSILAPVNHAPLEFWESFLKLAVLAA